jgi:hypothetical protein
MHIRSVVIPAVVLTLAAAGCAGKDPEAPTASAPSAASATSSAAAAPSTGPAVGEANSCAPQGGNQIKITGAAISCDDAYAIAARYDLQGEKYQKIDAAVTWTCSGGTAESRPLIFQCVSGEGTEFGVYPAA